MLRQSTQATRRLTVGSIRGVKMQDEGTSHVLGATGQTLRGFIASLRMARNLKPVNCLFLEFSMQYFGPW